jgi:hypothetical protein
MTIIPDDKKLSELLKSKITSLSKTRRGIRLETPFYNVVFFYNDKIEYKTICMVKEDSNYVYFVHTKDVIDDVSLFKMNSVQLFDLMIKVLERNYARLPRDRYNFK